MHRPAGFRETLARHVARAAHVLRVFVPFPARIQMIRAAGPVRPDETLMVMDEPDIAAQMRGSEAGMRGYQARLAGLASHYRRHTAGRESHPAPKVTYMVATI